MCHAFIIFSAVSEQLNWFDVQFSPLQCEKVLSFNVAAYLACWPGMTDKPYYFKSLVSRTIILIVSGLTISDCLGFYWLNPPEGQRGSRFLKVFVSQSKESSS